MKILAVQRIALAAMAIIASAAQGGAFAQECRTNYYPCSLNAGGRIDPGNPGCCWSPAAGPPNVCPRNFYKCDLNAGGKVDPAHPDCCWNLH
jgi:hypothetical protein